MGTLINIGDWYEINANVILGNLNYTATNFRTEAVRTYNDDTSRDLIFMTASSQISVVNFGYPPTRTTYNSYLLRDGEGNYDVYSPYVWNHVCFSFERGGYSRVVLVWRKVSIKRELLIGHLADNFRMEMP